VRFHIQQESDIPASTQLYNQICFAIAARHYPPGHRLPSTRQLAMQTGLHRNTISKVYRQLEIDGVVEAIAGSGIYVRDNSSKKDFKKSFDSKGNNNKPPDQEAKKAVDVALRNRWRRQALTDEMRDEVLPKNILMIGPTGVGKTEISRRLSKLAEAPFIKVEATRFTEVGYVGRDVEQIIRDLIEIAIAMERERKRKEVKAKAELKAEEKVLDALVGNKASVATRESFRKRLRDGDLDDKEIEIAVNESNQMPSFEIPGMPGANVGMINIGEMLGKSMGTKKKRKK